MRRKEKLRLKLSDYYKEENYIHYSNCHEDFLLLKKYIKPETKEILSIASGLDNSLSFLVNDNVHVYAFDYNPIQIFLGKLKICGIEFLSYEEFLVFIGIRGSEKSKRVELYNKIDERLPDEVKKYFDDHIFLIEEGLVNCGRFEQYFHIFRNKVFPLTCKEKDIQQFAAAENIDEQRVFYKEKINTWRFKLMFKIFFSKKVMSKLGRDKEYFRYSKESLPEILKKRVDLGFYNCLNKTNPYYSYVLNAFYKELPFYLKQENYSKIKKNIKNIYLYNKTFEEMLDRKYDFMNLSDIFEYKDYKMMNDYEKSVSEHLNDKGIAAFWNMMNVRQFPNMKRINGINDYLEDRAFFYRDFIVYEK